MALNEDNDEKQTTQSHLSKLKKTFIAIDQMEKKFQSLKDLYAQNVQSLADKLMEAQIKAMPEQKHNNKDSKSTARADEDCQEFFDDEETLQTKIKKLAELVKKSKHFVAFTGAGISTSAGIADFRSGVNTVLDTGAGKWAKNDAIKKGKQYKKGTVKIDSFKAFPSPSHMALVGLMNNGPQYLKYLVSQNTDGLHRRSGIPMYKISELHGNRTIEQCKKCGEKYVREYKIRNSLRKQTVHDHFTGRYCTKEQCGGELEDTIINFNEPPHEIALDIGVKHSKEADLYLTLGSSLTVAPACDMPEIVGIKWNHEVNNKMDQEPIHNLVIVNIQKTPLDYLCGLRIFAKIDDVMIGLMKELQMEIPKWSLVRYVKVQVKDLENRGDLRQIVISGVDIDGSLHGIFTEVRLTNNGINVWRVGMQRRMSIENLFAKKNTHKKKKMDEFVFNVPSISIMGDSEVMEEQKVNDGGQINDDGLCVELSFYGHYDEPSLDIDLNEYLTHLHDKEGCVVLKMRFDPVEKEWSVGNKREQLGDEKVKGLWIGYDDDNKNEEPLANPYQLRNDD